MLRITCNGTHITNQISCCKSAHLLKQKQEDCAEMMGKYLVFPNVLKDGKYLLIHKTKTKTKFKIHRQAVQ